MAKKYLSLEGLVEYDSLLKTNLDIALGNYQDALNQISSGTTVVGKAQEATHAESATTANSATEATHAVSADTATRAVNADSADNADNAAHAVTADKATTADSATKATQDGNGKVISETYETKADAVAKLEEAKAYTNQQVNTVTSNYTAADTALKSELSTTIGSNYTELKLWATQEAQRIKSELLNGADVDHDTLMELAQLIEGNAATIETLREIGAGKAEVTLKYWTSADV